MKVKLYRHGDPYPGVFRWYRGQCAGVKLPFRYALSINWEKR